jgi:hypothetical protein
MLYLYKPHITGPKGDITSPDVVIDYLAVDGVRRPLAMLTSEIWQQVSGETAQAAFVVTALGGGALLSPANVRSSGLVVVSRGAWRLNNLDERVGQVTLNGTPLAEVGLPEAMIEVAGGGGDVLPRGFMLIQTAPATTWEAVLDDPVRGRRLAHRVVVDDLAEDRWGDARPRPRYSVGPTQKEVDHYI